MSSSFKCRLDRLDAARLFASGCVVWIHVRKPPEIDWTANLCRFAVPFFTIAAILLIARSGQAQGTRDGFWRYVATRIRRLYVPFLVWSVAYAVMRLALRRSKATNIEFGIGDLLWNGTAVQLWFLPFIMIVTILCWLLLSKGQTAHPRLEAAVFAAAGVVVGFAQPESIGASLGYTAEMSWRTLPAAFFGLSLCSLQRLDPELLQRRRMGLLGVALALVAIPFIKVGQSGVLAESIFGLGFALFAFSSVSAPVFDRMPGDRRTAMGVYLVHPALLGALGVVPAGFAASRPGLVALSTFVVATAGAYLVTLAALRIPRLRPLFA